jgi:hypothetical protein
MIYNARGYKTENTPVFLLAARLMGIGYFCDRSSQGTPVGDTLECREIKGRK